MGGPVIGETAIEIARPHEILDEGGEHPVEGFLAIGPMPQDMADIGLAGGRAAAHQAGGEGHLVEGLVPNFLQPVWRAHPRTDTGIDEIEEKQPGETLRRQASQRLHHRAADIMANHAHAWQAQCIEQGQKVGRMVGRAPIALWLIALAKAPQIGCDELEAVGEALHHRLPAQPEFRPAMQQQQGRALAAAGDMEARAARLNVQMLDHRALTPRCPRPRGGRRGQPRARRLWPRHGAW